MKQTPIRRPPPSSRTTRRVRGIARGRQRPRDDERYDRATGTNRCVVDRAALRGARAARIWRRLCHHYPARLSDGARLRRRRGRHRCHRFLAWNGNADLDRRLDRAPPRPAGTADLWRHADGGNRPCVSWRRASRHDLAGRVYWHHQPVGWRSRRLVPRARGAGAQRVRRAAHAGVCAL